ncbi:uncharacterized protein LOC119689208 [Teleopsis dalmanni]|uniref:uncharacterized protein LOC119663230 n=1 Tax=Teleopsis dalmanni TaxID=139649 RepID=UPI0018CE3548|nr:uncharacterized protein LOC119663230 [Teleopsis dalmanni]XP_037959918.1 uncharacterized protein LOC119689208 [Teleopsis dalmanni]
MVTECIITKIVVCSDLAVLFDPLSLLALVIEEMKICIQYLWQLKLSWDLRTTWSTYRENLGTLESFKVSRHIHKTMVPLSTKQHIFADSSEKAFGAAAYVRAILKDGEINGDYYVRSHK